MLENVRRRFEAWKIGLLYGEINGHHLSMLEVKGNEISRISRSIILEKLKTEIGHREHPNTGRIFTV